VSPDVPDPFIPPVSDEVFDLLEKAGVAEATCDAVCDAVEKEWFKQAEEIERLKTLIRSALHTLRQVHEDPYERDEDRITVDANDVAFVIDGLEKGLAEKQGRRR